MKKLERVSIDGAGERESVLDARGLLTRSKRNGLGISSNDESSILTEGSCEEDVSVSDESLAMSWSLRGGFRLRKGELGIRGTDISEGGDAELPAFLRLM